MIQQLAQNNPQLAQALAQNPEALLELLGADPGMGDDGEPIPPGAHVLSVTPEERDAIERVGCIRHLSSGTYADLS
jgi:UV excision repair protein RAD23